MAAILTLIVVLLTSLIIVRVATVALTLTGLSRDLARFQARSAFSGAGFTTGESEQVVSHPVRRRIIMLLMLLGNAGIVTVISTLVISLSRPADDTGSLTSNLWYRILLLLLERLELLVTCFLDNVEVLDQLLALDLDLK